MYVVCKMSTITNVNSVIYSQMVQYLEYSRGYMYILPTLWCPFALWCFWHGLNSLLQWLPQYQSNSPEEYGNWLTRTHHELWYTQTNQSSTKPCPYFIRHYMYVWYTRVSWSRRYCVIIWYFLGDTFCSHRSMLMHACITNGVHKPLLPLVG